MLAADLLFVAALLMRPSLSKNTAERGWLRSQVGSGGYWARALDSRAHLPKHNGIFAAQAMLFARVKAMLRIVLSSWLLLAIAASACSKRNDCPPVQSLNYETDIAPMIDRHCIGCHSSTRTGVERRGAPEGVDVDSEAQVRAMALLASQRIVEHSLPISDQLSRCEQQRFQQWAQSLNQGALDAGSDGLAPDACPTCGTSGCVDQTSDVQHCGACNRACPDGVDCVLGECACPTGLSACQQRCVDTNTNAEHCGHCSSPCPAEASCIDGTCRCPAGTSECGGRCVDPMSDPEHCGGCDRPCSPEQVCRTGSCSGDCSPLTQCGAACVDTDTSVFHCGRCDQPCPTGASCSRGRCECPNGQTTCENACVNTEVSPQHCGECNRQCSGGQLCQSGNCSCPTGQSVCQNACVDTDTNPAHCGRCDNACDDGQQCIAGSCDCGPTGLSFSQEIVPIFTNNGVCTDVGCHVGTRPKAKLNLVASQAYDDLVNIAADQCSDRLLVVPGNPSASYLMDKLYGSNMCKGNQMPKQGVSLSAAEIEAIVSWICRGAPNN